MYGTLKRGGRFHDELRGAPFLGEATTGPGYALVRLGDYLALIEQPHDQPYDQPYDQADQQADEADDQAASGPAGEGVTGELFEVPEAILPALDEFEGDAYIRRQLAVRLIGPGAEGLALAYFRKPR